jgi:lipid II isoglutaminyl synthase (glutamine-hydrolysing)
MIKIVHLYPAEMNLYGDSGNITILHKRLYWRDIKHEIVNVGVGDEIPQDASILIAGGGQDAAQGALEQDLISRKEQLTLMAKNGVVMLLICGMYQLFGEYFETHEGKRILGLGILPVYTIAKKKRLIGNIVCERDGRKLVGYENHSGQTELKDGAKALVSGLKGEGNNDYSGLEGCELNNIFGTYIHGPVLAKNPWFADELINRALVRLDLEEVKQIDDRLEYKAAQIACSIPR